MLKNVVKRVVSDHTAQEEAEYSIHSNDSALCVSKTWSWCIMEHSKFDHKAIKSISLIFVCQELDNEGGERLLGHGHLFE